MSSISSSPSSHTITALSLGSSSMPATIHCLTASFLGLPAMQTLAHVNRYFLARISRSPDGTLPLPVRMQMASRSELSMGDLESYRQTGRSVSLERASEACQSLAKFTFKTNEKDVSEEGFPFSTLLTVLNVRARCNPIRALVLESNKEMPDKNLAAITSICGSHLTALDLGRAWFLTSTAIGNLGESCPHLRQLEIDNSLGITNAVMKLLAEKMPQLVSLRISSSNLGDDGILPFVTTRDMVKLEITYGDLTSATILSLAARAGSLRELSIAGNRGDISGVALRTLFGACRELRKVALDSKERVEDETVEKLVQHAPHLEELTQYALHEEQWNTNLTDRSICLLAARCPNLSYLVLNRTIVLLDIMDALFSLNHLEQLIATSNLTGNKVLPMKNEDSLLFNSLKAVKPKLKIQYL